MVPVPLPSLFPVRTRLQCWDKDIRVDIKLARLCAFDPVRRCLAWFPSRQELLSGRVKAISLPVCSAWCEGDRANGLTEEGSCINSAQQLWGEVNVCQCRGANPTSGRTMGTAYHCCLLWRHVKIAVPESCKGGKVAGHCPC